MKKTYSIYIVAICLTLFSCASNKQHDTLRDIDVIKKGEKQKVVFIKAKSDEEIRAAYLEFLKHATQNNKSRMTAINRLADIEFDLSNKILDEKKNIDIDDSAEDKLYNAKLEKTIELLTTTLRDYPKEKSNDRILYQLAKAYEQKGDTKKSTQTLNQLINNFPKSIYYVEAHFRIGEAAFSRSDYVTAEDSYTEVINSKKNALYFEKSTFKRGWARFKQNFYIESVDDFISAITFHSFNSYDTLDKSEKSQYEEYYRSIGLAFAYAGGVQPLREYLKNNPSIVYDYQIYSSISDIYLKQQRYSDATSVLEQYVKYSSKVKNVPYAQLKILEIWEAGGFFEKLNISVNKFYAAYNPKSKYWKKNNTDSGINKTITISLKKYILQMSSYYHNSYQQKQTLVNFKNADLWYKRYMQHYQTYVRKDNINFLYAELLSTANQPIRALTYYEKSAYDNELVLNKDAAYATIVITNQLYSNHKNKSQQKIKMVYLNKYIKYSSLFSQLYPTDKRTGKIMLRATELAFSSNQFRKTIQLAELSSQASSPKITKKLNIISAQSLFKLKKYNEAEVIYANLLQTHDTKDKNIKKIQDNLALSIYKQGETAKLNNNIPAATSHYQRIADIVPQSSIAATGLYDATALLMSNNKWNEAIVLMKKFQKLYPKHKLNHNISKKLSVAYLKSNQNIKAAQEFEKLSASGGSDKKVKMTALWQAAELYEKKNDYTSAIRSYKKYSKIYKKPFPQYMESLLKLVELNKTINSKKQTRYWKRQIIRADKRAYNKYKTGRTKFIVSTTLLSNARDKDRLYRKYRLVQPLKKNLRKKKKAMQDAVRLYGQASAYKLSETSTEATYAIASIYNDFSKALLKSEIPKHLGNNEKEQYKILLEDQAFPFEEKAIEFHELNLKRLKYSEYNDWLKKSFIQLQLLFPVRYKRDVKVDDYINVLH